MIATASYQLTTHRITVFLASFKTEHHGHNAVKYRWEDADGNPIETGWRPALNSAYMIRNAKNDWRFSSICHQRLLPFWSIQDNREFHGTLNDL